LFRFNTTEDQEFRFWFTRRVTLFILAATNHLIIKDLEQTHSPEAAKALAEFGKDSVQVSQMENAGEDANQYVPANQYPLGADPLLVIDVKCSLDKEGLVDLLSLDLVLPGGSNISLKLAGPILQGMCVLLNQLREHANWGDVPQVQLDPSKSNSGEPVVSKPSLH
jgi:hypothetical protein